MRLRTHVAVLVLPLAIGAGSGLAPGVTSMAVGGATLVALTPLAFASWSRRLRDALVPLRAWHLWLTLLFASGLTLRVRASEVAQAQPLDAAAVVRLGLVAACALAVVAYLRVRRVGVLRALTRWPFAPLTVLALVGLLSTAWSIYPAWTAYRSAELFVDVLAGATIASAISSAREARRVLDAAWLLDAALLALVAANVLLWGEHMLRPGFGTFGLDLRGLVPAVSRNNVGATAALLAAVVFARAMCRRGSRGPGLVLFAALASVVVVSETRHALLALVLAVLLVLAATRRARALLALALATSTVLLVASAVVLAYLLRGQNLELLRTLSSRTEYWSLGLEVFAERPLLGYGAFTGRFTGIEEYAGTLSSLHGTWPEMLVGLSVWGVAPLLVLVLSLFTYLGRQIRSAPPGSPEAATLIEVAAVFVVLAVRSVFSVGLIWHPQVELLALLVAIDVLRRAGPAPRAPR